MTFPTTLQATYSIGVGVLGPSSIPYYESFLVLTDHTISAFILSHLRWHPICQRQVIFTKKHKISSKTHWHQNINISVSTSGLTPTNWVGQWHDFLYTQGDSDSDVISMPDGFRRHLVGKTLRNVCHCDIAEIRSLGKLLIIRTFS